VPQVAHAATARLPVHLLVLEQLADVGEIAPAIRTSMSIAGHHRELPHGLPERRAIARPQRLCAMKLTGISAPAGEGMRSRSAAARGDSSEGTLPGARHLLLELGVAIHSSSATASDFLAHGHLPGTGKLHKRPPVREITAPSPGRRAMLVVSLAPDGGR